MQNTFNVILFQLLLLEISSFYYSFNFFVDVVPWKVNSCFYFDFFYIYVHIDLYFPHKINIQR